MRRIVTNLILARLVPMGIKAVQTAVRKRKSAKAQTKSQTKPQANARADNLDASSRDARLGDVTETAQRDMTDKATR